MPCVSMQMGVSENVEYPPSFQSNRDDDVNGFRGKVPYFQTN